MRELLPVEPHGGYFAAMPAAGESAMGAKLVTFYPGNAAKGLPTHLAIIVLFRPQTGEPLAMMDGRLITESAPRPFRQWLLGCLPPATPACLRSWAAVFRRGGHVEALRLVRDFEEIRVWGRTPEHTERFAAEVGAKVMSAAEAVRDADVVVTATSAIEPVLKGAWLKPART